jgi:hypothetical protein
VLSLAVVALVSASTGDAPSFSDQIWANVIVDWRVAHPIMLEMDLEPKIQASAGPEWWALYATPLVEWYTLSWLDLTLETALGYIREFPGGNAVEVTPRAGFRLRLIHDKQLSIGLLTRIEHKSLHYLESQNDDLDTSRFRLRSRLELRVGADPIYGLTDGEVFVSLGKEPSERFASKVRVRTGVGYKFSQATALELLLISEWTRSNVPGAFEAEIAAIDLRLRVNL